MKIVGLVLGGVLLVAAAAQLVGFGLAYTVDETEYVVITQFGEVKNVVKSPGLKFKSPVETVVRFDNRLLRIDVPTASMPDVESQFLDIDAYVRYRIEDPRLFIETLRDEINAGSTIGNIVIGAIRAEVGVRQREDIIGGDPVTLEDGTIIVEPRVTEDGIETRAAMMQLVLNSANDTVQLRENNYGVEIVDVRIKRADFPTAAENSVFDRMRSERSVQAQRLRAEGEQEYLTITADVNRRVRVISANAERDANILSGEGEAQAILILSGALEQDPEFYAFRRSLEAYGKFLKEGTTVVLSSNNNLFQYLENPAVPASKETLSE